MPPGSRDPLRLRRNVEWAIENAFDDSDVIAMLGDLLRIAEPGSPPWVYAHEKLSVLTLERTPWRAALSCRAILQFEPNSAHAMSHLALAWSLLGHHQAAIRMYRKVWMQNPTDSRVLHNLGHLIDLVHGPSNEAVKLLQKAYSIEPHLDIAASLAHALGRVGKPRQALRILRKANGVAVMSHEHQQLVEWLESLMPTTGRLSICWRNEAARKNKLRGSPFPRCAERGNPWVMRHRVRLFAALAVVAAAVVPRATFSQPLPQTPQPNSSASAPPAASSVALPPPVVLPEETMLAPVAQPKLIRNWQDAIADVKSRSTDLQIALRELDRAEAAGRIALAGALPTLAMTANVTEQALRTVVNQGNGTKEFQFFPPFPDTSVSYGGNLTLNVPLFAPRPWFAMGTAEVQQRVARYGVADVRRQTIVGVATAMMGVVTSQKVAELNRVSLRAALERLVLTKRRVELGAQGVSAVDVLRAEQDVVAAKGAIITSDENVRQARESFGLALGYTDQVGVPADLDPDTVAREAGRLCRPEANALLRPDVLKAEEQIAQARRVAKDVQYQYYPTISLVSTYSFLSQPFVNRFNNVEVNTRAATHSWTIAGVLNWNIWDGGVRYGNARDTTALASQAEARAEAIRRNALVENNKATRGVQVAETAKALAEQAVELARDADRLATKSFSLGRGTALELADAARRLREAEVQLAQRELEAFRAKVQAYLVLSTCE